MKRFSFSSLQDKDSREGLHSILANQDGIGVTDDTKVQLLLEGHTESLVKHGDTLLIGKEKDLRDTGILCCEGIEVGIGDLDHIGMEVLGSSLLNAFDGQILLNRVKGYCESGGGDGRGWVDLE